MNADHLLLQEDDTMEQLRLSRKETGIEMKFLGQNTVHKEDLVPSVRNLSTLASLYRSVVSSSAYLRWMH
jgi:exocyst complex component 4